MNRSALMAVATLGAFAFGAVAVAADEPNQTTIDPDHAWAMRFHLDPDARAACGIDTNQSRMSMRMWQRQRECLRDYFNGTLR